MLKTKAKVLGDLIDHLDQMGPMEEMDELEENKPEGSPLVEIHVGHSPMMHVGGEDLAGEVEEDGEEEKGSGLDPLIKSYPGSMKDYQEVAKPTFVKRFKTLA